MESTEADYAPISFTKGSVYLHWGIAFIHSLLSIAVWLQIFFYKARV